MAFGAADGKVIIDTQLNNNGFVKGVKGLKGELGGLKTVLRQIGIVVASAFAVRTLVNFGKECVELGSNVAEVQNVVDTAFGDMTYKVETFADRAIQDFGMSRLAAKKTASTYMAMAKGMGIADEAASDMSITLAGLTGDVASFYNISQELADTKLKSVFTGETETLKDLGVVMTQDNLKAYALSRGISKSYDAMTQAEKVALRYNYVLDSLALAQGDFAKTSDSWANQTRILSMQWQEFMSIVGQALITVLTPAVKVLNQIVSELITMATALNNVVSNLFGVTATAASSVSGEISESVSEQNALTEATEETAKAQKKMLAGFDEINKLGSDSSGSAGISVDAGTTGVPEVAAAAQQMEDGGLLSYVEKLKNAVAPFRDAFLGAVTAIETGVGRLASVFTNMWGDLSTLGAPLQAWAEGPLVELINQIITTTGNTFGGLLDSIGMVFGDLWNIIIFPSVQKWATDILPALTEFITQCVATFDTLFGEAKIIFDRIWQEAIAPALQVIQSIWESAWDSILAFWEKWGAPIFEKIRTAIQNTSDYLQNIWETIALPVWETIMSVVDKLWTEHLKPLWDNFLDFVGMLVDGALDIYNKFIQPVRNWFVDTFGVAIAGTLSDIVERIGDFFGVVADIASCIIDALKGVIDFLVGTFTGDWERALGGLADIGKGVVNGLITIVEYFANGFVRAINKVITAINELNFDVPDWVPLIGGSSFGFNIREISEIKLPRLATGAVIPPNREFLAVLGDQKSGTNIEAPLSTIEQAVENVLNRRGTGGNMTLTVKPAPGLTRYLKYELDAETTRRGGKLTQGGTA